MYFKLTKMYLGQCPFKMLFNNLNLNFRYSKFSNFVYLSKLGLVDFLCGFFHFN